MSVEHIVVRSLQTTIEQAKKRVVGFVVEVCRLEDRLFSVPGEPVEALRNVGWPLPCLVLGAL